MRGDVDPRCFDMPIFDGYIAHDAWLRGEAWPSFDALNAALRGSVHPVSGHPLRFVAQTPELLADGLHYEQRILREGVIATREHSWHDLFNALMWIDHRTLKAALNARQVDDIAAVGTSQRTRAQCALTHFDEAGAILVLRDATLLEAWDAHDWQRLFLAERAAWFDGRARAIVFGHALLEHALRPEPVHTAKCLAVIALAEIDDACLEAHVAGKIRDAAILLDPQEMRPLPLSGIPGWHPENAGARFYEDAECFRPLREGRRYAPPLSIP